MVVILMKLISFYKYKTIQYLNKGGWPSGQWHQTVNLTTKVYVGSNPTPPIHFSFTLRFIINRFIINRFILRTLLAKCVIKDIHI